MFNFLGSIFGKIASVVASVFVAVGLVSAPASVAPQPIPEPAPILEEVVIPAEPEIDVKAELEKLKQQLAEEQIKRKVLEKKVTTPAPAPKPAPIPVPAVVTPPPPVPVVVTPPPTPVPAVPAVQLLPGQFMLPSGAIVDSTGKVVKEAPASITTTPTTSTTQTTATTTTAATPPTPVWPPAEGSTVNIKRSIFSVINFNTHLTCDQLLSLPPSSKDLCKLYKENTNNSKYTWNIIEDL